MELIDRTIYTPYSYPLSPNLAAGTCYNLGMDTIKEILQNTSYVVHHLIGNPECAAAPTGADWAALALTAMAGGILGACVAMLILA